MLAGVGVLMIVNEANETVKTVTYLSIAWVKAVFLGTIVKTDAYEVKDFREGSFSLIRMSKVLVEHGLSHIDIWNRSRSFCLSIISTFCCCRLLEVS